MSLEALAPKAEPATRHTPTVLLTAKVQGAARAAFASLPVEGVLVKPFGPMLLPAELFGLRGWC